MTDLSKDTGPVFQDDPTDQNQKPSLWWRAVPTVLFFFLFAIAETILFALAVIQFFWMLFNVGQKSPAIAEFGDTLGKWLRDVALFQTAQTDKRPFPWRETR